MRFLLSFLSFFFFSIYSHLDAQNLIKVPFFENIPFHKGSKELVILVNEPRTDFARNFGNRIYSDSAFLKTVNETFYFEVNVDDEQIVTLCGYDFYFYLKTGPNLRLIKTLNSECMGEKAQGFMNTFAENGRGLRADTLVADSIKYTSVLEMYNDGVVLAVFEGMDGVFFMESNFNNSAGNYPRGFYGGQIQVKLEAETPTLMSQLISNFFGEHQVDSLEYKLINWKIESISFDDISVLKGRPYYMEDLLVRGIVLTVSLDQSLFDLFKGIPVDGIYHMNKWPLIVYRSE